ncbi:MAG: hypothetical protein QOI83_1878 [Streptomycetaceae bacterium]|nr:hypothetical protein [Streptomycetaceae bacterium]
MPAVPAQLTPLLKRRHDPVVVQTVRSAVGATIAYQAALWLTNEPAPLTAPLTALLVVQVTFYATLTTGVRRAVSVVGGVLIAIGFGALVGLTWWSLGILILASLVTGHFLKVDEFVAEVAISAMLVLGVAHQAAAAWDRVLETLIGAAVGVLLNALFAPPVFLRPAGEAVEDLACKMRRLLERIGEELGQGATADQAGGWLHEARRLNSEIARVDAELSRAEESTRLNPRVRHGMQARIVLRSGLDTLEICAVVLRTLCRSLSDLARPREGYPPLYDEEIAAGLQEVLRHVADAVDNFGRLITAQVTAGAERAEAQLARALTEGRAARARVARLLRSETDRDVERWELHGALLANIDRLLDELDVEKRSHWLATEFDRYTRTRQAPGVLLHRIRRRP